MLVSSSDPSSTTLSNGMMGLKKLVDVGSIEANQSARHCRQSNWLSGGCHVVSLCLVSNVVTQTRVDLFRYD